MTSLEKFDTSRASALQREIAARVITRDRIGRRVRRVGGVDASVKGGRCRAAVVVLDARTLEVLEERIAERPVTVPYIPGYLTFRELPSIRAAFAKLSRPPDLVLVDGMGRIHPRRCGIACHLGVELDVPAIGCGKSPFGGEYEQPPVRRGTWRPVTDKGERLGAIVRTRDRVKPVFISTGHRVSLATAIRWALRTATKFRLPEPIRQAHRAASLRGR